MKTRERLFTELKAELELHTSLEEQHLFPILRRNAETKELVVDAIKDNKELRAKLAELEALPKNNEAFPERLKELQKAFRQHARDEKRELLPAVQRALSEEQMQGVTEKMEAGVAEAEQARHDEVEERRLKVRQEREQAERQAEAERSQQAAAEQARQEEAAQKRAKARHEREAAERQAEQEAAAQQAQEETAAALARSATAVSTNILRVAKGATTNAQRAGVGIQDITGTYMEMVKSMVPDFRTTAALPEVAVNAMIEIRSAWIEWMAQTTRAGIRMSQELMLRAAEQQQGFAADTMHGWMEKNARVMEITMRVAQEGLRPVTNRPARSP